MTKIIKANDIGLESWYNYLLLVHMDIGPPSFVKLRSKTAHISLLRQIWFMALYGYFCKLHFFNIRVINRCCIKLFIPLSLQSDISNTTETA